MVRTPLDCLTVAALVFDKESMAGKRPGEVGAKPLCTYSMEPKGITIAIKPNSYLRLRIKGSKAEARVHVRPALTSSSSI